MFTEEQFTLLLETVPLSSLLTRLAEELAPNATTHDVAAAIDVHYVALDTWLELPGTDYVYGGREEGQPLYIDRRIHSGRTVLRFVPPFDLMPKAGEVSPHAMPNEIIAFMLKKLDTKRKL